ncbi:MAG: MBL fold metallo-hydrolase [Actinomycetota bacterium]|nr:MBL fold metallo-hydrolase [Actinomycetota bacterium]
MRTESDIWHLVVVPTPYRVGPANVYVLDDGPLTLFDCGPNTPAAMNALRLGMAGLGLALEQVARVVISHGHPDHYGLAPAIQEASGAQVFVGEHDLPKINERRTIFETGALLMEAGIPMEVLVDMGERDRKMGDLHPPIEHAIPLSGGERFQFDDFVLEAMHLPGHTSGHICLLEPERRILFAGDTLLLHISPNPLLEPRPDDPTVRRKSLVEYLHTLDVLESLELTEVWPGHGEPILDPPATIRQIKEHHQERKERLAERLDGDGKSPFQLAREMWQNLEGFDNFLAVSEVVAHLDLLEMEGRAEQVAKDGVAFYRRPSDARTAGGSAG